MSYVAQNKIPGSHNSNTPAEGLAYIYWLADISDTEKRADYLFDSRRRSYISKCIVSKVSYTTVQRQKCTHLLISYKMSASATRWGVCRSSCRPAPSSRGAGKKWNRCSQFCCSVCKILDEWVKKKCLQTSFNLNVEKHLVWGLLLWSPSPFTDTHPWLTALMTALMTASYLPNAAQLDLLLQLALKCTAKKVWNKFQTIFHDISHVAPLWFFQSLLERMHYWKEIKVKSMSSAP